MSANIEELSEKHAKECAYAAHDKIGLYPQDQMWVFNAAKSSIRNALTEQAEAFKGELQAYDGTVRELAKTVEDMRAAQAVPVVGGLFDLEKLESLGWQIAVCQMCGTHASAIKPAAELATLREKAAEADDLRKDAERYRWIRDKSHSLETRQYDKGIVNGPSCYHEVEGIRELKYEGALDAAIDAAIAQGKGE